jgi:hypothetical protein
MRFGRTASINNMVRERLRGLRIVALALALMGAQAEGFGSDGGLSGRVLDQNGEPIPGAVVSVQDRSGQKPSTNATTDHQGAYSFERLEVGEYSIRAQHAGFRTVSLGLLRISPGATLTWNATMGVAQLGMARSSDLTGGLKRDGRLVSNGTGAWSRALQSVSSRLVVTGVSAQGQTN